MDPVVAGSMKRVIETESIKGLMKPYFGACVR
jgi:hypothetical protein